MYTELIPTRAARIARREHTERLAYASEVIGAAPDGYDFHGEGELADQEAVAVYVDRVLSALDNGTVTAWQVA